MKFIPSQQFKSLVAESDGEDLENVGVRKSFSTEVRAPKGNPDRQLQFTISTAQVDREGDTIKVSGWDLRNFKSAGSILWAHDHSLPPIARPIKTWREGEFLKSIAEFTPHELNPFGDMVFRMYREKFLRAVSVGFLPIEYEFSEDEERAFGIDFHKQELLEYSAVPVPANPGALIEAGKSGIDLGPLKSWTEQQLDEWSESESGMRVPRHILEELYAMNPTKSGNKQSPAPAVKAPASFDEASARMKSLLLGEFDGDPEQEYQALSVEYAKAGKTVPAQRFVRATVLRDFSEDWRFENGEIIRRDHEAEKLAQNARQAKQCIAFLKAFSDGSVALDSDIQDELVDTLKAFEKSESESEDSQPAEDDDEFIEIDGLDESEFRSTVEGAVKARLTALTGKVY